MPLNPGARPTLSGTREVRLARAAVALELLKRGLKVSQVKAQTGLSDEYIRGLAKEAGIPLPGRGRPKGS